MGFECSGEYWPHPHTRAQTSLGSIGDTLRIFVLFLAFGGMEEGLDYRCGQNPATHCIRIEIGVGRDDVRVASGWKNLY